ncbi:hypothetical protein [Cohnella sp. AR92]|uniref:hypothetical protein n=1 Tax=Cohnella sp. AR92 TaxID=648716 RepID=UPI000F8EDAFB|nr:hypothetical protein [Cohnella sp. AR92]RUS46347.1 hypothetical protein ELR57_14825 [Cohnella sp. AR92]
MEPWISIVITGAAIAGYGLMIPKSGGSGKTEPAGLQGEAAYDRLLEDLEAENRELIEAVTAFKREQDDTVDKLSRRIREMERQMSEWSERGEGGERQSAAYQIAQASVQATAGMAEASVQATAGMAEAAESEPLDEPLDEPVNAGEIFSSMLEKTGDARTEAAREEAAPTASLTIKSRYSTLLELYERGRSIEQIAREMNMNKGEIQLILQLARREDNQRV